MRKAAALARAQTAAHASGEETGMAAVEEEGRWEPTAAAAEEEEMGVEAEEAMEDGEVEGEVGQQQQEEEGNGDAGKSEEHGSAGGRMVWKKKHHHHHQPRTPVAAESRATWRGGKGSGKGRGGGGGGGGFTTALGMAPSNSSPRRHLILVLS